MTRLDAQEVRPLGGINARLRACAARNFVAIRLGAGEFLDGKRGEGEHAAFRPDGPDEAVERIASHPRVEAASRHGDTRRNPRHRMLASPREHARHLHDSGRGNSRLRFGPFGRLVEKLLVPPRAHPARESFPEGALVNLAFEPRRLGEEVLSTLEIANVVAIPKPLGENHAGNGGREGAVGSGNNGDPATGVGAIPCEGVASLRASSSRTTRLLLDELGRHRAARVDDVNRRTATKSLGKDAPGVCLLAVRGNRVGTPQDGALQMLPIVVMVVVCPIHHASR